MGEIKKASIARFLPIVAVGAGIGTLLRAVVEGYFPPDPGQWPWATFWINIGGSFVLGFLLEFLALSGEDTGWIRGIRLGAGTGIIGGFTTYSTFILEIDQIARAGHFPIATVYALVSVGLGLASAFAGLSLSNAVTHGTRQKVVTK